MESEALEPVEAAFRRALELSEKDGSIVLSAGSMFVTAEVMTAWDKIIRDRKSGVGMSPLFEIRFPNHE